jgi:16S rRNA (uracil1498-N3)-methyltransferase
VKGRFFVTLDAACADRAYLDAAGVRHLRALRLVAGDAVCAIVAPGRERAARIARLERERVVLELGAELAPAGCDPRAPRTLAIALGDPARMDLVVEKATELGASALQPFVAARSQARTLAASRRERWQRIARTASEQCGRTVAPEIRPCLEFDALVGASTRVQTVWLLLPGGARDEHTRRDASPHPARRRADAEPGMLIVVGPEGGLTEDENERLLAAGAEPIVLGRRVLRFETAAIAGLSVALDRMPDEA